MRCLARQDTRAQRGTVGPAPRRRRRRRAALQELAGEKVGAQRKKAGAELDVADLEDKLAGNEGAFHLG